MNVSEIFAIKLKMLREENNLSQSQLAEILNVSRGSLSFYEHDGRTPDIEFLATCAKYFDVTIEFLMGYSSERCSNSQNPIAPENNIGLKDLARISGFSVLFLNALAQVIRKPRSNTICGLCKALDIDFKDAFILSDIESDR